MSSNLTMAQRLELWKASKLKEKEVSTHSINNTAGAQDSSAINLKKNKKPIESANNATSAVKKAMINAPTLSASGTSSSIETAKRPSISGDMYNQNVHPNLSSGRLSVESNRSSETSKNELEKKLENATTELEQSNLMLERVLSENEKLKELLAEEKLKSLEANRVLEELQSNQQEIINRARMTIEENSALEFENSIQSLKISELEQAITKDRIEVSELVTMKSRKHKEELQRLATERLDYENRANGMIQEVTQQMAQLQHMAMQRIEQLESELMAEREKTRSLEDQIEGMKPRASSPVPPSRSNSVATTSTATAFVSSAPSTPDSALFYRRRRNTKVRRSNLTDDSGILIYPEDEVVSDSNNDDVEQDQEEEVDEEEEEHGNTSTLTDEQRDDDSEVSAYMDGSV